MIVCNARQICVETKKEGCVALRFFALLCFALLCFAWLCLIFFLFYFALFCSARIGLFCFVSLCFALHCVPWLGFTLNFCSLRRFALFVLRCFVLRWDVGILIFFGDLVILGLWIVGFGDLGILERDLWSSRCLDSGMI